MKVTSVLDQGGLICAEELVIGAMKTDRKWAQQVCVRASSAQCVFSACFFCVIGTMVYILFLFFQQSPLVVF